MEVAVLALGSLVIGIKAINNFALSSVETTNHVGMIIKFRLNVVKGFAQTKIKQNLIRPAMSFFQGALLKA